MKRLKIGIFGLNRGEEYVDGFLLCDTDIVAVCDFNKKRIERVLQKLGKDVAVYNDFAEFISHPMDVVVIANYFHEHAQFVIESLKRNLHVFCECSVAVTMAECVNLVRVAEKSKGIFMLAENYPFMAFNQEMKRVCDEGSLGNILYAEGEYNHPLEPNDKDFYFKYCDSLEHWRNYLPRAYYVTHSLAPLMYVTNATPIRVTAMPVYAPFEPSFAHGRYVADRAAIITTLNEDNSVFKITGCAAFGAHGNSYRFCGENGQIENIRGLGNKIMLRYNKWNVPKGQKEINFYEVERKDADENLIRQTSHEGADFLVVREFVDCVRNGRKPVFDIYFAVRLAMVGILAHRSLLDKGVPYDIPDLHLESERINYENDKLSPFAIHDRENLIPCCSNPEYKPSQEQLENYLKMINKE